jgi:hypothetical protein
VIEFRNSFRKKGSRIQGAEWFLPNTSYVFIFQMNLRSKSGMPIEGDVILIYHENSPTVFARVEFIEPDVKKGWYQITLQLLTIPTQVVTWILRDEYLNGAPFTMGGKAMRLEEVRKLTDEKGEEEKTRERESRNPSKPGTVIPFKRPGDESEREK